MYQQINQLNLSDRTKNKLIWSVKTLSEIPSIYAIILFGSYARGTFNACSDIDLLVILDEPVTRDITSEYRCLFDEHDMDVVFYYKHTFRDSKSDFVKEIRKEGKVLWTSR